MKLDFEKELREHESRRQWNMRDISVSLWELKKAVTQLQNRKAAGADATVAEHIKHGEGILLIHLSFLFQGMLRHSFIPEQFLYSRAIQRVNCSSDHEGQNGQCI